MKHLRHDIPVYELIQTKDDFLVFGKTNGNIYNSLGQIVVDGKQFAEVHISVLNDTHVVKQQLMGNTINYE